ncbi:unnamed protein product [Sphagnum jensenii]|uniref:C2H2-type domain-containing protein n=1 Tax=Sphagnum jensenii TaxID=128206 RepID=A0ABP1A4I4_9BRYO
MKKSTLTYAKNTWTDEYGDDEYNELLSECSLQCQLPKEQGQKRCQWQCKFCTEVFKCKPSLNYHRYRGCPKIGHRLKMYPMVGKGKRDVVKHACCHKGFTDAAIQEGTKWQQGCIPQMTVETYGSLMILPAGSKEHKQVEMGGHTDFIQECAVEDEKWTWSPLYILLRDYSLLSTRLPRPWKHTAEEWDSVWEFIATNQATKIEYHGRPSPIVAALYFTWRFHFDEWIGHVELSKLRDRLEDASEEKEFVNNLLRLQDIMMSRWHGWSERKIQEQQILANDVASFKATSESPGHQEVIKRICSHFVGMAHCVMEDIAAFDSQQLKDMWIGGHLKSEQEMLIATWRDTLDNTIKEKWHADGCLWIKIRWG